MTQTLEGAERSETVVNMLAGFQTECVQAVNALAQTQFSPNVNAEQHRYTKHKLLRVDDGGNLPISMEASHIHRLIARKHAYLLASECGLDGVFKREQMKYDLAQTVKKVF